MGITEKMQHIAGGMKSSAKTGVMKAVLTLLRLLSGFFLGLTLALVGLEVGHYGTLSLVFVTLLVLTAFMRLSRKWTLGQILIFDLVIILVAQLLRMYILLAP
jgi:hypothetical protein